MWVGFPDAERTMRPPATRITVTGGSWPAQIWQLFEGAALAETPVTGFPPPESVTTSTTTASATDPNRPPVVSVVGMSVAAATRALRDAGYPWPGSATARAASYPPGVVFAQDPPAGRPTRLGTTVTMIVADGPPTAEAGSERARRVRGPGGRDAARRGLRRLGPRPARSRHPGARTRVGKVWRQAPISAELTDEGTTVTITVNP